MILATLMELASEFRIEARSGGAFSTMKVLAQARFCDAPSCHAASPRV
jgi:hypothetical protein